MWLHPYCSRTVRGAEEVGEWFTEPVSILAVRLPLILSSQRPSLPWTSVLSQLWPLNLPCHAVKYMGKNIHYYNNVFRFGVGNKIASATNLRSLKWSYSCSNICVGPLSSSPIFWDAKTSAVKGHAPYSPTAATLAAQSSLTSNKITTGNCCLVTINSTRRSSPSYTMCYFNLQWNEWTMAAQSFPTNKTTTGNCSLVTKTCGPSPGNVMCYLNLKWSEYLLWPKIYKAVYHDYGQWFSSLLCKL